MEQALLSNKARIASIDFLRGLVMIIMALDHTRDFFHKAAMTGDPLDPSTTTPALFFTRWITHFCAPVFLLLSGLSAYLSAGHKTKSDAGMFLIKRGFWLIMVEIVIVTLGLSFNPFYNVVILQVIWATGWSMVILGLLVRTSFITILLSGLIIFFGHNVLDHIALPQTGMAGMMWKIWFTAKGYVVPIGNKHFLAFFYTILPWTSVMLLGYCIGPWFKNSFAVEVRRKRLLVAGFSLIVLFVILRITNSYGDPQEYTNYHSALKNVFSFLNASKYPPSLQYCCMTLGPALVLLAVFETIPKILSPVSTYGKVPFFYYVLHFYVLHLLLVIIFFATGHTSNEIIDQRLPFFFRPMNFGFGLAVVYFIWISVVLSLYLPCKWYLKYKATHNKWWLSYI